VVWASVGVAASIVAVNAETAPNLRVLVNVIYYFTIEEDSRPECGRESAFHSPKMAKPT